MNNTLLQSQNTADVSLYENMGGQSINQNNLNSSIMSATSTNGFIKLGGANVKIPGSRQIPLNKFSRGGNR